MDPSLGAQFQVHLVKLIILSDSEVGTTPNSVIFILSCRTGRGVVTVGLSCVDGSPKTLQSLCFSICHVG